MALEDNDRRVPRLVAGDRRLARLVGSDRIAPVPVLLDGELTLPALRLSGFVSPEVELGGMPSGAGLELAGGFAPVVEVAGALPQSSLQLAGGVAPSVALGGSMVAPSLQLAGGVSPAVALAGAPLAPSLQLAGAVAPSVALSAALGLPTLALSGGFLPVVALGGSMQAPSLQLAGGVSPEVKLKAVTLQLPSLQLAGAVAPSVTLAGAPLAPSLQLAGGVSPAVALGGSMQAPSLQLSGALSIVFEPVVHSAGVLAAWLRLQASAQSAGHWTSWVDTLNSNPSLQIDTDRQPVVATSANGLPLADFDGTSDCMPWPLTAQNNDAVQLGVMFWIVPDAPTTVQRLITWWNGTGGTNAAKCGLQLTASGQLQFFAFNNPNTRTLTTTATLTPGVPVCIGFEYNGSLAAEADKAVLTLNGVAVAVTLGGGGAMPAALATVTGNAMIGALDNLDAPGNSFNGSMGPNGFVFKGAMPGVTAGQLTPAYRLGAANYEAVAAFNPVTLTGGAVTGWLRLALGTSDVNGYSSVPDFLSASPATQSVNARKTAAVVSANGLPLADFGGTDVLLWAYANSQTYNGFMVWLIPAATPAQAEIYYCAAAGGALGAAVVQPLIAGSNFDVYVYTSASAARRARVAGVFSVGVPVCVGWEFNGTGATEADRCVLTVNGVAATAVFSDGFGGAASMPTSLRSATGNVNIGGGGDTTPPATPYTGKAGPHFYRFGALTPGVTSGLITPAARLTLANYQAPT